MAGVELYDAMRTTGSTREFTDDPVPDEVLARILDHARFAGSGGNRQPWHVIVLRDAALRAKVRDAYSRWWDVYLDGRARGLTPYHPGWDEPSPDAVAHRPNDFVDQMTERPPVMLLVCALLGSLAVTDQALERQSIVAGASIYPFVHNLLLAATNEGLGAVLTTIVARAEVDLRPVLAIPDGYGIAALIGIGVPAQRVTKLTREPVDAFTTIDRFDGPALTP